MDCEYILVYKMGLGEKNEFRHKFHAATPYDAKVTARLIVKHHQEECVQEHPFSPVIVNGELYRQIEEIDGGEFVKTSHGQSYAESVRK